MELGLPFETYVAKYKYKYLALYQALREAILSGNLPVGVRLPATRELARMYGISRGAAAQSYDMLLSEGYVETRVGSGTYVAQGMTKRSDMLPTSREPVLSVWGKRLMDAISAGDNENESGDADRLEEGMISFTSVNIPMELFPYAEWRSALAFAGGIGGRLLESGPPPAGDMELRKAIAGHLRFKRGIEADPEQIVVFSGSMQGLMLLFQLLVDEGEPVVLEDPGFPGIYQAVSASGGIPLPSPVDAQGLVPSEWEAKLLVVSPSRQYPTGKVLPLERRRALLNWAGRRNAWVIEDDYDSEFRWGGRPIEPLKVLDHEQRVIYIGSFSKTMFNGLRLGYAVLPPALVSPVVAAKAIYEPISPASLEQRALARFMQTGGYARHLRRMTKVFGARYEAFCEHMNRQVPEVFRLERGDSGLLVYASWLKSGEAYNRFRQAARDRGVVFRNASVYHYTFAPPAACFAFAHLNDSQIEEGVRRLAAAWTDMLKNRYDGGGSIF
ncbi:PLP-dependent aminotransferase family protein [Paenibacillus sp. FSL M8-0334]|uniref:Aminotransferase class I/II-fold pyridoxal phosphate-dependent enzyme n=1 Tax=Paenibacillus campinasensis TaxID=66347 RepID=A0ABW9T5T3_9BACL|nr:PLP-dependent aminotransferase family protein [Paenibacillus campinasensis]MUG66516.1 aminotransferase class I/II-fold pyridoxal phosphate-dependent enzyme [Paenibacillus campinasensis]